MSVYAAVLAAGSGSRFGGEKAVLSIGGRPMWRWPLDRLAAHPAVDGVGVVGTQAVLDGARSLPLAFAVPGGATRAASCRAALEALPEGAQWLLVQDAARPWVEPAVVDRVLTAARRAGAAAPALPVVDTIRQGSLASSMALDRNRLFAMQTPQAVRVDLLRAAFEREGVEHMTDELSMVEAMGVQPELVEGDPRSFKITFPEDLARFRALVEGGETRTGLGYDVHAFSDDPDRPLWIGCVRFEGGPGLAGHSDADPLAHAIVDALLGAAVLGDIGQHFPPGDPRWMNAPSATFLEFAALKLNEGGWSIRHIDAVVIAEFPKIMPRAAEIRASLAKALGIDVSRVSVKATTHEKLGAIGQGLGIAAQAIATIVQMS